MAGMNETGLVYQIEDSKLCPEMLPFANTPSTPITTRIALTVVELQALDDLAQSHGYNLGRVSLMPSLPA